MSEGYGCSFHGSAGAELYLVASKPVAPVSDMTQKWGANKTENFLCQGMAATSLNVLRFKTGAGRQEIIVGADAMQNYPANAACLSCFVVMNEPRDLTTYARTMLLQYQQPFGIGSGDANWKTALYMSPQAHQELTHYVWWNHSSHLFRGSGGLCAHESMSGTITILTWRYIC